MIPNVLEKSGVPQWESCDGTLWWCHALAAIWAQASAEGGDGAGSVSRALETEYSPILAAAIASIEAGLHRGLRLADNGLLEVTEAHSTWMDARVDGKAVSPRLGALPEINALWFQARCLHGIWTRREGFDARALKKLGRAALSQCLEVERPNGVFLHSVPLAPSFVLRDTAALSARLKLIATSLWTPVGLRTLSPTHSEYRPRYSGDQRERDQTYHQGLPWAWLGGHYQMARARLARKTGLPEIRFESGDPAWGPLAGHVAELFDAEPPFAPRGAPAQAWSLACFEEEAARRRSRVDAHLTRVLAQRWLAQMEK
jgi:4-alpha-glucanotransferase